MVYKRAILEQQQCGKPPEGNTNHSTVGDVQPVVLRVITVIEGGFTLT